MAKEEYQTPLALDTPQTNLVGHKIMVRQIHVALFPEPAIHIGYAVGQENEQGEFEAHETHTRRFNLDDINAANDKEFSLRENTIKKIVSFSYELLQEGNHVGKGSR